MSLKESSRPDAGRYDEHARFGRPPKRHTCYVSPLTMKEDSPKPPIPWAATLARELYAKGHTPSEVVGELQQRGVVGDITFISIARAAWGLGLRSSAESRLSRSQLGS